MYWYNVMMYRDKWASQAGSSDLIKQGLSPIVPVCLHYAATSSNSVDGIATCDIVRAGQCSATLFSRNVIAALYFYLFGYDLFRQHSHLRTLLIHLLRSLRGVHILREHIASDHLPPQSSVSEVTLIAHESIPDVIF